MKKRILSLILALSMVLSVFPLGAFAAGSTQDLVIGSDGYPVGSEGGSKDCNGGGNGNDWEYYSKSRILCLNGGTFDLSTTEPVKCEIHSFAIITGGTFNGAVYNLTETISGGIFNGTVTNDPTGKISGGTFQSTGSVENKGTITGNGTFNGTVTNNNTISGGTFQSTSSVTNYGTINGNGTFNGEVTNHGNIKDGTFEGTVKNYSGGTISGGTFAGSVQNMWDISGGVFNGNATLTNVTGGHNITWDAASSKAKIEKVNGVAANWAPYVYAGTTVTITASTKIYSLNGKRIGTDYNSSYPNKNDKKTVTFTMPDENVVLSTGELVIGSDGYPVGSNGGQDFCSGNDWEYSNYKGTLHLSAGTFDLSTTEPVKCEIQSRAKITGGTFNEAVTIIAATITKGIFSGTVYNSDGKISGGTFQSTGSVTNWGEITGGTFAGSVENKCDIYGGVFNRNATLTDVPDGYSITWDKASSKAKITEVNDVSADWAPYVVVTDEAKTKVVTITADTDIYSLNGYPIDGSPYTSSYPKPNDKKTVTFTMPNEDVVLGTGELVMEGGYPVGSNNGTADCEGKGWTYSKKDASNPTGKLTLTRNSGTYDFSYTYPQNTSKGVGAEPVACAIEIQWSVEITGGIFAGEVTNEGTIKNGIFAGRVTSNGTIMDNGTFNGTVTNSGYIKDGTFNGEVTNSNTIENGTFAGSVTNEGTIKNGSFEKKVTNGRTIMDGVFKGVVENGGNGTIFGGTFAGRVNNSYGGHIFGGVFNGHINVPGFGVYPITVDTASSKAEIKEVNGVSAVWEPYVVVTELTKNQKVIITASTKIYSLNHKPLSTDNCNSAHDGNENTVKFTMPNANVVLNGAITSTDLVMENGWPKDSDGGKNPCKGDGWEYIKNDPTNGDMLLLTGSSQTGGLFDFSTIGDGSAVECNVFVGKPTAITGGEFNGKVFNNSGILGGTFHGEVDNMGPGRIENGTFKNSVENNGMIENGTFHDKVKNNGTIEKGTFEGTVENNTNGTISGGTFAGSVSNNGGTVNGGIFNGNTGLDGVTDLHSITWDAASSNAKIEKVNGVSADWAPYVVTSNATTKEVTITADTEIFSLNGQPIAESSYGVDKKTVTFTMPDDDVVLNSELITKPEPEPEPEPEPKPEPEPTTYTVTVIGGTIDGKTSVSAKEKDTLTVVLDQNDIPDGMTFDMWSISSSKLSGDINVDYRAEAMTFQMPAEDVTIRAQYRSAEIIEDAAPSPLATAATIAVGGAAAGIVVWQGVNLGVDLYLANALPQGVPVPTDRRALALLLWETAGKPEVALPTLYGDIPAEEIELQKATRWAVQNGLMDAADKKDASFFDPDHYVTKMDVFGAWLRLKKLLGTIGTSPTQ